MRQQYWQHIGSVLELVVSLLVCCNKSVIDMNSVMSTKNTHIPDSSPGYGHGHVKTRNSTWARLYVGVHGVRDIGGCLVTYFGFGNDVNSKNIQNCLRVNKKS